MRIRYLSRAVSIVSVILLFVAPAQAQLDHFLVEAAGGGSIGTQRATESFSVKITAQRSDNSTDTAFTGKVLMTSTGILTAGGDSTAAFVAGVLTSHAVTVGNTGTFTLTATRDAATGTSVSFPVVAFTSDDFNHFNLKTGIWTFTDPLGDVTLGLTGTGTSNARLALTVPAGVEHDLWTGKNTAPRVLQDTENSDFVIQTKFDSGLLSAYQIQGIIVQQDLNNLMRIDLSSGGTYIYVYAASTADGFVTQPTTQLSPVLVATNGTAPLWLRVTRTANDWAVATSLNGVTFTTHSSFSLAMTVTKVGLFAGNAREGISAIPGFTMLADYFFDNALPVSPEDGGAVIDNLSPLVYNVSSLAGGTAIRVTWKTDERSKSQLEYGTTTSYGGVVIDDTLRTSHTLQINGLASSTNYHFRILAADSLNQTTTTGDYEKATGVPSVPNMTIWHGLNQVFGKIGTPQRWVNILGNVTDPIGIDSLYYRLNGGAPVLLSRGPDLRRLQNAGDFNIDLGYAALNAGPNTVSVRARNLFGDVKDTTITVFDSSGTVWALPYRAGWGSPTSLKDSVQVVDGKWEIIGGKARATERGYDRCFAIGDTTWQDYVVTTKLTVYGLDSSSTGFDPPSSGPAVGILMRWTGHTTMPIGGQPLAGYLPLGALGWIHWTSPSSSRWEILGNNLTEEAIVSNPILQFGTSYYFKFQVQTITGQGGYYRFKVWKAIDPEPAEWLLNAQEGLTDPQFGSVLIVAHHVTVDIDEVRVTAIPTDVNPPVISLIASETAATSAYITWRTDEPANARVAYGLTSAYGDTAMVGTALRLTHGVPITGLNPNTTYHYKVLSADATGNLGTSSDATFMTGSPAVATTLLTDELNTTSLNSMWTFTAGVGDESYSTPDTVVQLIVPSGVEHDLWTSGYRVPRIMQNTNNTDFEVEVKWNSGIYGTSSAYRLQGIVVEQDPNDLIRFDFTSSPTAMRIYAAAFNNGFVLDSIKAKIDSAIAGAGSAPIWLRVKREGNIWTQSYSYDGTDWVVAGVFHHALTVSKVGVFAGNAGGSPPQHTGIVDYFRTDGATVNIRALLQGPYMTTGDTMRTNLTAFLPKKNPYGVAPWNYTGGDSVQTIPSGVVDWVLVSLRTGQDATTGVDTIAAFLKKDGSVVGLDGNSLVRFPGVKFGSYYVVLRHRNHLAIMSANSLPLNGSSVLYDFTMAQSKAFSGGSDGMKLVGSRYTLFAGNGNGDGVVNATDRNTVWRIQNGLLNGYYAGDFNLDAVVNATDRNLFWRINNGTLSQVP